MLPQAVRLLAADDASRAWLMLLVLIVLVLIFVAVMILITLMRLARRLTRIVADKRPPAGKAGSAEDRWYAKPIVPGANETAEES